MDTPASINDARLNVAPAWNATATAHPRLEGEEKVDVAIVGGGIAGLTCALELADRGLSVAVLERGGFGEGSTGWCAGILSESTTIDVKTVEDAFGKETAQRIAKEITAGLQKYAQRFGDAAQWQTGSSLYLAARKRHHRRMQDELRVRLAFGLNGTELSQQELEPLWNGFTGALSGSGEHGVHPVLLVQAIVAELQNKSARLFERTEVRAWKQRCGRIIVQTGNGTVIARNLILAGGLTGSNERERRSVNRLLIPVIGHVLVTKPSAEIAEMVHSRGVIAAWDSLQLYHYMRYLPDGRMLVGGEEKAGAVPPQAVAASSPEIRRLHRWAQAHHGFKVPVVESAWKASLILPSDGFPVVRARTSGGCHIISVVTDGLPFSFALGAAVSRHIVSGNDWLTTVLSEKRKLLLQARLASLLPQSGPLRALAHSLAFTALELSDWL